MLFYDLNMHNRSITVINRRAYVRNEGNLSHREATWAAGDYNANYCEGRTVATVVRLPRRLFRDRRAAYHHVWMLNHGAQPSWML